MFIFRIFKETYLTPRFFTAAGLVIAVFVLSFLMRAGLLSFLGASLQTLGPLFFIGAKVCFALLILIVLVDLVLLNLPSMQIEASREVPKMFSLSDENSVKINLRSSFNLNLKLNLIDELPEQFQMRDFSMDVELEPGNAISVAYTLRPLTRGAYEFHNLNIFVSSFYGLIQRRLKKDLRQMVPVYPSIVQMKQYELKTINRISTSQGIKKMRRIGNSYEFEQIRNYVKGDDYRSINWKATSRRNELMVNQYEDERSQQIYCIIDKSRSMKMPFNGLSLMDYAINSSLVISNIALKKHDKAGLLTFSDKLGKVLNADNSPMQLRAILEALYREEERKNDANYELLYAATKRLIRRRSLLMLYTNFESFYALQRVLPLLRKINMTHLLVVIFFENTEISSMVEQDVTNVEGIYTETVARHFLSEKARIAQELQQYGIQTILSRPEDLSINTINKYLELKAKRLI
jgi:uncharacterized protein (DUF58 family)